MADNASVWTWDLYPLATDACENALIDSERAARTEPREGVA